MNDSPGGLSKNKKKSPAVTPEIFDSKRLSISFV